MRDGKTAILVASAGAIAYAIWRIFFQPKLPAKILAFEWSPMLNGEIWEPVSGAVIDQSTWYWGVTWVNNLDTFAEYWGIVRVDDEPHALGYTSAEPGETVTRLLSGWAALPGTYEATARITPVGDDTEVIDQVFATYQVL